MPYTFTKATPTSNMLLSGVLICNIVCIRPSNHVTMCIACNESHQLLQFYSQCKFYCIYENESCLNPTIFAKSYDDSGHSQVFQNEVIKYILLEGQIFYYKTS